MNIYLKIFVIGIMLHGVQTYGITVRFRTSVQKESYKNYELQDFNLEQTVEDLKNHIVGLYTEETKASYSLKKYQCLCDVGDQYATQSIYTILNQEKTLTEQKVKNDSELVINSLENDDDLSCCYNIFAKTLTGISIDIDDISFNSTVGD